MKKWIAAVTALVMALVCVAALAEDQLAAIQARGEMTIATEGNWSPWTFHDENDRLTGFDIEVARLIAEKLGVTPVFKETEWSAILAGVDSGVFDLACNGVGYTPERAEKYAFSDPYVYTESVLVVAEGNGDIKTTADLAGRKTANSPNSTYATLAEQMGAEVTYAESLYDTIQLVMSGRVDATINAKGSVEDFLREHPDAPIRIVETFPGEPVVIPMRKGEETDSLVAAINAILAEARENGTLAELSLKYFNQDLTKPL